MEEQSVHNVRSMTKFSLMLGVVSFVLLFSPSLLLIYANRYLPNRDFSTGFGLAMLAVYLFSGSLILGIVGLAMSLRILRRIKRQGDAHTLDQTMIISLVLNGLVVASILVYLALGLLYSVSPPPPPPV